MIKFFYAIIVKLTDQPWLALIRHEHTGFDLSSCGVAVKIDPFATLIWVNKDENIWANKFFRPIGQYIFHSYWKQIFCMTFRRPNRLLFVQIQQH